MTPSQWIAFEKSLAFPHGSAELLCDGRKVVAQVTQTKPLRYEVMVYVDGAWRGEWLRADPPRDEHRFLNPHSRAMYTEKDMSLAKKVMSARQVRDMASKRYHWFSPTFATAKALRRRLVAGCQDIQLIDCTEARVEALVNKTARLVDSALAGEPATHSATEGA